MLEDRITNFRITTNCQCLLCGRVRSINKDIVQVYMEEARVRQELDSLYNATGLDKTLRLSILTSLSNRKNDAWGKIRMVKSKKLEACREAVKWHEEERSGKHEDNFREKKKAR